MDQSQPSNFIIRETWLSRKPDPLASFASATATLGVVLLSILSWNNFFGVEPLMAASKELVFHQHQYWRAWTTLFVHGDGKHLLSNALFFFVLGSFLMGYFGIALVLVGAFFLGGVTNLWVLSGMPLETHLIGLSGVVFWMGGAWLMLYFLIERKRSLLQRFLRSMGVTLVLFMPAEAFDPSVSYKTHLVGFLLGLGAGFAYFVVFKRMLRSAEVQEAVIEDLEEPTTALPE